MISPLLEPSLIMILIMPIKGINKNLHEILFAYEYILTFALADCFKGDHTISKGARC